MCPYDSKMQDALREVFTQEEIDRVLPEYIQAEEKRMNVQRIIFYAYGVLLFGGVVVLVPYAYMIPELARFLKSIGTFGDYALAAIVLSILIFIPGLAGLFLWGRKGPVSSMSKEDKFKFYAGLIVRMRKTML